MNKPLFFPRCYYILIAIAAFTIPFTAISYFFLTPLLLICWIIEGDWKRKWNALKTKNVILIVGAFVLFWLINVIGLFYSNDLIIGGMRTYDKLPFLIYPLVFFTLDKNYFTKEKLDFLLQGFLCAVTIMLLICLGNAFVHYLTTKQTNYFFYNLFAEIFGHPAYCTVLVTIAFVIVFSYFNTSTNKSRRLWGVLLLFYGISIYFLQTRSGILAFIAIIIFSLGFYLSNHRKKYGQVVVMLLIVMLFSTLLLKFFPGRVEDYFNKIVNIEQLNDADRAKETLGLRGVIWHISYDLAMENKWLGIGTGYKNEQFLQKEELETIHTYSLFINAHNQFLQTFLEHGVFGLLILIFLFLYSFYYALKTKNYLLFMLLITFFINILFESMLERSRGIFAFSLFYCLFMVKNNIFATVSEETIELDKS